MVMYCIYCFMKSGYEIPLIMEEWPGKKFYITYCPNCHEENETNIPRPKYATFYNHPESFVPLVDPQ